MVEINTSRVIREMVIDLSISLMRRRNGLRPSLIRTILDNPSVLTSGTTYLHAKLVHPEDSLYIFEKSPPDSELGQTYADIRYRRDSGQ